MHWFFLGAAALILIVIFLRWLSTAGRKNALRALGIIGAVLFALLALRFAAAGKLIGLVPALASLASLFIGRPFSGGKRSAGTASTVETDTVRMTLDHDSGEIEGEVRRGRFEGKRLSDLSRTELVELWLDCRRDDAEAARLLESYLDRIHGPHWRDEAPGAGKGGPESPAGGSESMSRDQAYAVLGLEQGASADAIKRAHRDLLKKLHPDHGGSDWLSAKINQAKDILLEK